MPGMKTYRLKGWARLLMDGVAAVRRITGTTVGGGIIAFALVHGFTPRRRPTTPGNHP